MHNKLRRYAMLYIAEMMEEYNDRHEDVDEFMEHHEVELEFADIHKGAAWNPSVTITVHGRFEACFQMASND